MMIRNIFWCKVLQLQTTKRIQNGDSPDSEQGFTLLEALMVVFMIGILAAIATPSWLSMLNNTRLKKGQDAIALAISDAQRQARQNKSSRQVTLKQDSPTSLVQWAVHPPLPPGSEPNFSQNIEQERLIIDPSIWSITFDDKGHTQNTGTLLISLQNGGEQRCVIVQTLLGTVHKGQGADCSQP